MRKRARTASSVRAKLAVPPDEMMISSSGSKVNPSHLAHCAARLASRNSVKVSTFDQFSPWLQPMIFANKQA
jgi:hypothetical protein